MSSKPSISQSKWKKLLLLYPKDMAQTWIIPWILGYVFCYNIPIWTDMVGWNFEAIFTLFASVYAGYTLAKYTKIRLLYTLYSLAIFIVPSIIDILHVPVLYLCVFTALGYITQYNNDYTDTKSRYSWLSYISGLLCIPIWRVYTNDAIPTYVTWSILAILCIDTIYRAVHVPATPVSTTVTNMQILQDFHKKKFFMTSTSIQQYMTEIGLGLISSISMLTIIVYLDPFVQFESIHLQFLTLYIAFPIIPFTIFPKFISVGFLPKYNITKLHLSILYFALLWVALGFISVQGYTIFYLYSILGIAIFGLLLILQIPIPDSTNNPTLTYYLGSSIGFCSVYLLSSDITPLYAVLALTLISMVIQNRRSRLHTFVLVMLISGILYTNRQPTFTQYPFSPFSTSTLQKNINITSVYWNKDGWFFRGSISSQSMETTKLSKYVTSANENQFIIDNKVLTYNSIESKNEAYFASIIQHWTYDMGQMTILHDTTGIINKELGDLPTFVIHIATDHTRFLQEYSLVHQDIRNSWLLSNRIIHPIHSDRLLHTQQNQQVIIEVMHEPWASSISSAPTLKHAQQIQRSLSPNGMAFFIIHLQKIPEYAFLPILHNIENAFTHVQYWKAKDNIDSVLVVAQNTPFSFGQFASKWRTTDEAIEHASNALFSKMPIPSKQVIASPQNQPTTPILHVAALYELVESPKNIWSDISIDIENPLHNKIIENQNFLRVLQETSTGDLSVLQQNEIQENIRENLIRPHIQSAKKEISLAQKDGQTSSHWENANAYILTAQMIAPQSVEALLLLGEIGIGQGFLDVAEEKFNHAIAIDSTSTPAYNGLARVAGLRKQDDLVEKYLLEAQRVSPGLWVTHYNLAIFYQENSPSIAYKSLIQALELPNGDNIKTRMALVENFIIEEKWTRALIEVDRLIQLQQPASTENKTSYMAQLWFLRGRIHFGLELWDKAEEDFRKATLDDPNFHAARGSIGLVKIAKGDLEGAQNAFRATLHFDPNNIVAKENLQKVQIALQAEEYQQRPQ